MIDQTEAHFWSKVLTGPGCWKWVAFKNSDGYGIFGMRGRKLLAHRVAWKLTNGEIPPDKQVLHSCDNPGCVRPDHLWLGTVTDNLADRDAKGRVARGELHYKTNLTRERVAEIRKRFSNGQRQIDIAREMGIHFGTVWNIVRRRNWAWLTEKEAENG